MVPSDPYSGTKLMHKVQSGPHTGDGPGDVYVDNYGRYWETVPDYHSGSTCTPAALGIRQFNADGTIR